MNDPLGLFSTGSVGSDPLGLFSSNVSPEYQKYSDAYDADNQIPIPGSPAKAPKMSPEEFQKLQFSRNPTLANIARAGVEQGLNLAGGTVGMFAAPIQSAATGIANLSQGKAPEFGKTYEESLNNFSSIGSQAAQALGQSNEFTQGVGGVVGDIMNNVIPMAPLHIPTAGGRLPGISSVVAKDMQGISVPKPGSVESKVNALISEPIPPKDPLGLFEKTPVEPGASAFDKIVESQIAGAQEPIRPYTTPMDFVKNQLEAQKQSDIQAALEQRQQALQQEVARQTSLDMNAAERARQQQAPIPGLEAARQAELDRQAAETQASIQRTQDLNTRGQQMSIVEDYGNNDPMSRMPNMRVDENGIPIRADLSMEAQNLQDPLQMHLWGDELPNQTGDGGIPLTQALDSMPKGPERDQAIAQLANDIKSSADLDNAVRQANTFSGMRRGQAGAVDFKSILELFPHFKDSKIKRPLFHASTSDFDLHNFKTSEDGALGPGIYLTPDSNYADLYSNGQGGNVRQLYVNLKNPLEVTVHGPISNEAIAKAIASDSKFADENFYSRGQARTWARRQVEDFSGIGDPEFKQMLKDAGYDGVVLRDSSGDIMEATVLNSGQLANALSPGEPNQPWASWRRSQTGAIDFQAISETVNRNVNKLADAFDNFTLRLPKLNGKDQTLSKLYETNVISRPKPSAEFLEAAKQAGDGPALWKDWQSGIQMASDKINNPMVKNFAQWLDFAKRKGDMGLRVLVRPVERLVGKLSTDELVGVQKLIQAEMFNRKRFDESSVREALSPKSYEAYKQFRDTYDEMYKLQNEQRLANGLPELSREDAYMASVFHGDWHVAVRDKEGKLLWYAQNSTRAAANKAVKFLQKYYEGNESVNPATIRTEYKAPGSNIPTEMMGSWRNIIDALGDSPDAGPLEQAYKAWVQGEGRNFLRQNLHQVEQKMNVRGAAGDQPWLDAKENAYNWAHAQIEYMQKTMRYLPMQEALDNVKTFLSDPELQQSQPNNIGLLRAYTANALGLNGRLTAALEAYVGKALGRSANAPKSAVGALKSATYAAMLWGSPGYWLATPIQALPASFAWFLSEKGKGTIGSLEPKQFAKIMIDAMQANIGRDEHITNPFNKEALKWADDNQVVTSGMFDPESNLGKNKTLSRISKVGNATVSLPDTFSRRQLFLTFANAYKEGGMPKEEAFMRSAEQVEKIMVSMRREDRPIMVQKFGALGDAAWVFKAPVANMYNHLSIFAREAKNGNPKPLLAYLGSMALIGGVFALPFINEWDSLVETIQDLASSGWAPPVIADWLNTHSLSPKEALLSHFPDKDVLGQILNYGAVSAATGINMSTRFKNDIGDISNPMKTLQGPLMQEFKEWGKASDLVTNPGMNSVAQAAYQFAPGPVARGVLENTMPQFKTNVQPDNGSVNFKNPNNVHNPDMYINRDSFDRAARMAGLTSLKEAQYKDKNYLNTQISMRQKSLRDAAFKRAWESINDNDTEGATRNIRIFLQNGGDLGDAFAAKALKAGVDPQTYMQMHANTLSKILDVQRRMEMN